MSELITVIVDQPRTITNVTRQNVTARVTSTAEVNTLVRQQLNTIEQQKVTVPDLAMQTTTVGLPGIQGPAGQAGSVVTVDQPAGSAIQGHFMVRSDGVNLWPVDTSIDTHATEIVGIALGAASAAGQSVSAQTNGPVTDSNWSWAPGVVFCGADGRLTQSPSSTGWLMQVGRVSSPTTVDIDIEMPIYRG